MGFGVTVDSWQRVDFTAIALGHRHRCAVPIARGVCLLATASHGDSSFLSLVLYGPIHCQTPAQHIGWLPRLNNIVVLELMNLRSNILSLDCLCPEDT